MGCRHGEARKISHQLGKLRARVVLVTLLFEDGTSHSKLFTVAAMTRLHVDVFAEFATAPGRPFGALVEALGDDPIELVVERATYWDANGVTWAAGTNALGTRLP